VLQIEKPGQASWMVKKITRCNEKMGSIIEGLDNLYGIKKAYGFLRKGTTWGKTKLLWLPLAVARHNFCVWLAVLQRLVTCERLQMIGFHAANACYLCQAAEETNIHLFFSCEYSRLVWDGLCKWLDVHLSYECGGDSAVVTAK